MCLYGGNKTMTGVGTKDIGLVVIDSLPRSQSLSSRGYRRLVGINRAKALVTSKEDREAMSKIKNILSKAWPKSKKVTKYK